MRFSCHFHNKATDERKSLIISFTESERKSVERLRKRKGDDSAEVTACAMALRHAYQELDAHAWHHVEPPKEVRLS